MTDKTFNEQFKATARAFAPDVIDTARWKGLKEGAIPQEEWLVALWSDDLMRAAASFRQEDDFLLHRKYFGLLGLIRETRASMAGTRRKPAIKDNEKAAWKGFAERRLSEDELAQLDEWRPKPSEAWGLADQLIGDGYRLTMTYNKRQKLSCCTIIDDDAGRASGGYALSSFDGDCALALKMALFKHFSLMQGDWTPLLGEKPTSSRRG